MITNDGLRIKGKVASFVNSQLCLAHAFHCGSAVNDYELRITNYGLKVRARLSPILNCA